MLQTFIFDEADSTISVGPDVAAARAAARTVALQIRSRSEHDQRAHILPATNVKPKRSSSRAALDLSAPFSVQVQHFDLV